MTEPNNIYYKSFKILIWGLIILIASSCGGGDSLSKNPYCEFVDGQYTFDVDLRRSMFYVGKDFEYKYYTSDMEECRVDDAAYVKLKAVGHYYDENIREEENVEIFYSSLIELPDANRINDCSLNIFTTLEAERIIYLVRSGYSYAEAQKQVEEEIWNQLKESGLFSFYDFMNVKDFKDLEIDDDCLASLTAYFSKLIYNTTMVVEDKSLCSSVLLDFVNNYAVSGDLELSTFNLDVFSKIDTEFFTFSGEKMLLKTSIAYYKIPFQGGVPQVHEGRIYYGIDTATFENNLKFKETSKISLIWPKFKDFTCNGYVELHGLFETDSLYNENQIEILVKDLKKKSIDTTIRVYKDVKKHGFSEILWLEKEGKFEITVRYGDEEIDLNVNNKLELIDQED